MCLWRTGVVLERGDDLLLSFAAPALYGKPPGRQSVSRIAFGQNHEVVVAADGFEVVEDGAHRRADLVCQDDQRDAAVHLQGDEQVFLPRQP